MSTLLARVAPLKPEIRLAQAITQFEEDLPDEQKGHFHSNKRQSCHSPPNIHDVMRLTAEIDRRVAGKVGGGRCFGTRLVNVLEAVQRFAALGDVVVGGSQNMIVCGVWSLVRMSLLVRFPHDDMFFCLMAHVDACERLFLVRQVIGTLHDRRPIGTPLSGDGPTLPTIQEAAVTPL